MREKLPTDFFTVFSFNNVGSTVKLCYIKTSEYWNEHMKNGLRSNRNSIACIGT